MPPLLRPLNPLDRRHSLAWTSRILGVAGRNSTLTIGTLLAELTYPALSPQRMDSPEPDTELTDDHMRLLGWLDEHPRGSLTAAAQLDRRMPLGLAPVR